MPRLKELLTDRGPRRRPHAPAQRQRRPGQRAGRGRAGGRPGGGDRGGVRVRRPRRRPHRRGDRRRGHRRPVRHRGHRPGALPGHLPARGAATGPRGRPAAGRGRRRLPGRAAASSTSGCPTASRRRRWPSWKWDKLLGVRRHRPELEHRPEAGRAERADRAASPIGVTHVASGLDGRRRADTEVVRPAPMTAAIEQGDQRVTGQAAGPVWPSASPPPATPLLAWSLQDVAELPARPRRAAPARGDRCPVRRPATADLLDQLILALDEMASNALRHGGGGVRADGPPDRRRLPDRGLRPGRRRSRRPRPSAATRARAASGST